MAQALVHRSCSKLRSAIAIGDDSTRGLQEMLVALEAIQPVLEDAERWSAREFSPAELQQYVPRAEVPGIRPEVPNITPGQAREWLKRVRNAAYDIMDMAKELQDTRAQVAGKVTRMLPCLPNPTKKQAMAYKMTEELKEIELESTRIGFRHAGSSFEPIIDVPPNLEEPVILGRDGAKQSILAACDTSEGPVILHIHGEDGVGKTALAAMVFNDTRFRHHSRVWIDFRWQGSDLHQIGESIISQLSGGEEEENISHRGSHGEMEYMTKRLHELFVGNKVLVVLDGLDLMWDDHIQFKRMFGVGDKGSKVIVIVASLRYMNPEFFTAPFFFVRHLHREMCWTIIKQRSGFEDRSEPEKQELEKIGPGIAERCSTGIPLAAAALGGMLRYKDAAGWAEVLNSDIWKEDFTEISLTRAFLKFTYRGMPPSLRLCFAYCAIFPRGHTIAKDDLIHQWIALGFLEPSGRFSATQLGEQQIRMLLGISFLQTTYPASTSGKDKTSATLFTMPDIVHEFALSLIVEELIVLHGTAETSDQNYHMGKTSYQNDAARGRLYQNEYSRYALLSEFDARTSKLSSILPAKLRMLRYVDCTQMELNDSFSFAKFMCVLVLKDYSMQKLPESICELGYLGYLDLSGCSGLLTLPESFGDLLNLLHINLSGCSRLTVLPESFGKPISLVHIDLSGCSRLGKLPKSFGKLINLVHVDLSGCSGLEKLPESFGNLTNLVHINLSGCSGLVNLPHSFGKLTKVPRLNLSGCSGLVTLPETFGKLINLEHIYLSGCSGLSNLPQSFGYLINLLSIDLSCCHGLAELPVSFSKLEKLEDLNLSFWSCFKGIEKALDGLTNLQRLNLSQPCCSFAQPQIPFEGLKYVMQKLTKLQYLNLSMFLNPIFYCPSEVKTGEFIECISAISSLKHLDLSHNMFLRDLPECICRLKELHTLDLSGCIRLKSIAKEIGEMKSLKSIVVRNCRCLNCYQLVVKADDSSSNLIQLEDADFEDLEISCLENVKSTEEGQRISLVEKRKLQKLKLCWTSGSQGQPVPPRKLEDNALLGKLVPPHSLQCLELHGYSGELCPMAWWTERICSNLLNLTKVTMEDVWTCSQLPPLGLLPNLERVVLRRMSSIKRIDANDLNFSNRQAFKWLSNFTIDDMPSLQQFNTRYYGAAGEVLMFPVIDELVIQRCPVLRFLPFPPSAQRLVISDCKNVMIWRQTGGGPSVDGPSSMVSPVTELVVERCSVMLNEWHLLHCLPGLRSLTIHDCSNLTCSLEMFRALSSLQTICFSHCDDMDSLPEHLGFLASLQELQIVSCKGFKSLPESMKQLSSLQSMHFTGSNWLHELPEWLGELTSLQKLAIGKCGYLDSLPQSIQKLTKLKDLYIWECGGLKSWCESEENKKILGHIRPKLEEHGSTSKPGKQPHQSGCSNSNPSNGGNDYSNNLHDNRGTGGNGGGGPCIICSGTLSFLEDEQRFEYVFKMKRGTFNYICWLANFIEDMNSYTFVDGRVMCSDDRVAIALRMLISGGPLETVGSDVGASESTVWPITWWFVQSIQERAQHHLCWPDSTKMEKIKSKFELIHGLPNCCGVVDTTYITAAHLSSAEPNCDHEKNYSMAVQVVVDPDMRFTDLLTEWSGTKNQPDILHGSLLRTQGEKGAWLNGSKLKVSDGSQVGEYIIGDPGYPLLPWLLTPYQEKDLPDPKVEFNRRHTAARAVTLRALARLKDTWKFLHGELWHPNNPQVMSQGIHVCCLLHNIVIDMEGAAMEEEYVPNKDVNYKEQVCQFADENAIRMRDILSQHLTSSSSKYGGDEEEQEAVSFDAGDEEEQEAHRRKAEEGRPCQEIVPAT